MNDGRWLLFCIHSIKGQHVGWLRLMCHMLSNFITSNFVLVFFRKIIFSFITQLVSMTMTGDHIMIRLQNCYQLMLSSSQDFHNRRHLGDDYVRHLFASTKNGVHLRSKCDDVAQWLNKGTSCFFFSDKKKKEFFIFSIWLWILFFLLISRSHFLLRVAKCFMLSKFTFIHLTLDLTIRFSFPCVLSVSGSLHASQLKSRHRTFHLINSI